MSDSPVSHEAWPWFRFEARRIRSPQFRRMSGNDFKLFVFIECIANDHDPPGLRIGALPPVEDVADLLRFSLGKTSALLNRFVGMGLLRQDAELRCLVVTGWPDRQYASDNSARRVGEYRSRIRATGETPETYRKLRPQVLARDGFRCVYCGATEPLVVDHMIPLLRGGDSQLDNLVTACRSCNAGKAGRLLEETAYKILDPSTKGRYVTVRNRYVGGDGNGDVTPPDTETDPEADPEAEAEQNARAQPEFHPSVEPAWPDDEDGVSFESQYVMAYRKRTGRDHPGASVIADCKNIERDFGRSACVQAAMDTNWEKGPRWLRERLADLAKRQTPTAPAGRKSDLYDE